VPGMGRTPCRSVVAEVYRLESQSFFGEYSCLSESELVRMD
jgi:hypothetical protein